MSNKLPQVVLFQNDEIALNYRYKLPYELDKNIAIKSIEYDLEDFSKYELINNGRVFESDVYLLHPYKDNTYIEQSLMESYLINEKLNLYSRIASLLGANQVRTYVEFVESESYVLNADGSLKVKIVELSVEYKEQETKKYTKSIEISNTYSQSENFNLHKNIDDIYRMISKYNLSREVQLVSLVEGRDDRKGGVMQKTKRIRTELTTEVNNLYQLSAKVTTPIFNVNFNLKKSLERVNKLMVELEFIFDE